MKFIPFLPTTWRKRKEKQHSVPSTPPRVTSGSRPSHSGSYLSYRTVPLSPGALSTTTTHSSLSISSTHSSSSIAPRRPPRPPSLRLDLENEAARAAPFDISKDISITLSHRAPALSPVTRLSNKSSSSQLDNVWDDFLSDTVRGDTPTTREYKLPKKLPRSIHSNQQSDTVDAILDPLTPSIRSRYQSTGSTPHLPYTPDANDRKARPILSSYVSYPSGLEVKKGDETDFSRALSLFPSPPLQVCKKEKKVPNPLVLQPTPTIAPLPASPTSVESDSYDTTPLATPVTPTYHNAPCISISSQRSPSTVDASWLPGNLAPFDSHQLYLAKRKVPVSPLEPQHTSLSNFNQGMGPPKLQKMHTKFLTVGAKPSRPANAFPLYNSAAHKPPTCRDFQWGYAV